MPTGAMAAMQLSDENSQKAAASVVAIGDSQPAQEEETRAEPVVVTAEEAPVEAKQYELGKHSK